MKWTFVLIVSLIIVGVFSACPSQETPTPADLHIQIQGHVYDNQTKQPVADQYVGLYRGTRTQIGLFTWEKVVETHTDSTGFYSLQCNLAPEPCSGAKLFLMPISDDNGLGTPIGCTDTVQTIDLFR